LDPNQLSTLVPWVQAIEETLKKLKRKKSSGKVVLPNGESLVIASKAFLCFTCSPNYLGRNELPDNLKVTRQHSQLDFKSKSFEHYF
jgi:hypothetical protein